MNPENQYCDKAIALKKDLVSNLKTDLKYWSGVFNTRQVPIRPDYSSWYIYTETGFRLYAVNCKKCGEYVVSKSKKVKICFCLL